MNLKIEDISAQRSFVFLWCGSYEGLDLGRVVSRRMSWLLNTTPLLPFPLSLPLPPLLSLLSSPICALKCLKKWGFRRCEDICWVKSNTKCPGKSHAIELTKAVFQNSKVRLLGQSPGHPGSVTWPSWSVT